MNQPHPLDLPVKSLSKSLTTRVLLLGVIGVVGLASTIALGWLMTLQRIQSRMERINDQATGVFDRFFLDIQTDLKATGEGLASRQDQDAALLTLRTRNRAFLDVMLVTNGVMAAQRNAIGRPKQTDVANRAWLKAPPPFGQVLVGPVQFEGDIPYVDMAVLVTDDISLPAGILVVRVDLTALWNTTLDVKVGASGYAYIVDSAGQLVAFRNRRLLETGNHLERLVGRTPQAIHASFLSFYTGLNGKYDLASARPLTTVAWFAILEQPAREALAPFLIPALVLLAAILSMGGLLYSTIRFTRFRIVWPLLTLRDAVGQMADGQREPQVKIQHHDELGQLSQSFNRMAAQLRQAFVDQENQIAALQQAQASLRATDAKQGAMIANIADVIGIVDQHGITRFKSPNLERWFGWKPEELVGTSAWALIQPNDFELVQHGLAAILGTPNATRSGECRYRCKDGTYKWIELTATNLLADPDIAGILLNYHDISERKLAQTALQLSDFSVNHASLPTFWVTRDARIVRTNLAASDLLGYTPTEFLQLAISDLDLEFSAANWPAHWEDLRAQRHMSFESRHQHKAGHIVPVEVDLNWFEFDQQEYTFAYVRDLRTRKLAEESLARLATVVEQASEIIVITDTQGQIVYVNPTFEKITGYSRAEAIGRNPRLLKSGRQDAGFYVRLWDTLKRGEVWKGHFVNRRQDGTFYEEEATISPVREAGGKIINYVGVKRDVTRERQLESELRQSQKMEAIGQLAGGVAHDFNNILSALLMQTDLLAAIEPLPKEALDGLQEIRGDVRRAADLTRQLLLFSRRQVMQTRLLDLNELIMHLAKMLQRIIREDVKLELNLHAAPLLTRADAGMLDQVLMNLAVNARDAMTAGGRLRIETAAVSVDDESASLNPDARPGRFVCFSVGDTGGGIPPEILPRIFEPFFTTKEAGKGTGLGLATVFGIVKQHQGWIQLHNQPGEGVTFHICLPACDVATVESVQSETKPKPRGGTETVLLVEDEPAVRKPIRKLLERQGYQVVEAADGVEALACWAKQRGTVALLLTDLVMPGGISGQELARRLQAEQPQLKVIYTSGYSADIAGKNFQLRQGEAFLQKPYATNHLLETLRQCLEA